MLFEKFTNLAVYGLLVLVFLLLGQLDIAGLETWISAWPPVVIALVGLCMASQFIAVWLQATATATEDPAKIPWITVLGFLLLQSSGAVRSYDSGANALLVSMVLAFPGSVYLGVAKWRRSNQHDPIFGWTAPVMKRFIFMALVPSYIGGVYVLMQHTDRVPVPELLLEIAGFLMILQIISIWGITLSALRARDTSGFSLSAQVLLATLQTAGTILALQAGDVRIAAAMFIALVGTFITMSTLIAKPKERPLIMEPAE